VPSSSPSAPAPAWRSRSSSSRSDARATRPPASCGRRGRTFVGHLVCSSQRLRSQRCFAGRLDGASPAGRGSCSRRPCASPCGSW
jgi:hypothetical protein